MRNVIKNICAGDGAAAPRALAPRFNCLQDVLPDPSLWLKVTEEQLADQRFVQELVLIGQDVWHVQNRIFSKVSKRHPNVTAFQQDLKKVFSQVSRNAERLKASSREELREAINVAAKNLRLDILSLMRWKDFQEKSH